ncbi:hypothetical protein T552_01747 [Pneumocystis carinii B80]|uniref:Peptidase S54 rhomboid domain-containing protein n=1 Tax=Pneumocystis carinii (strain B80) TaxID=1408658 RepID=A0A0W4ZJE8_PNEC8|nr:hypothetical protein T552_01747 [Pneumocystis carinii B80]KTW28487.1 hypothetical protein T552_01747 [Pneumocystis carinii B80]
MIQSELKRVPIVTRLCVCMTIVLFVFYYIIRYLFYIFNYSVSLNKVGPVDPYFVIIPGISYIFVWTFFIASFIEKNIFMLFILLIMLLYGGKYLEKSWGSKSFLKFILVITIIPNLFIWILYIFYYMIVGKESLLIQSIHGGYGLYAGFLVALKQLIPEHVISFFKGIIRIRIKYTPALYIFIMPFIGLLARDGSLGILSWLGFLSSWIYLRFFKWNTPNLLSHLTFNLRGDNSETFAFSYFFPKPIHLLINTVSRKIHNFLVSIHIFSYSSKTQTQQTKKMLNNFQEKDFFPYSNTSHFETERRKSLALKALEERLGSLTNSNPVSQLSVTELSVSPEESFDQFSIINNENKNKNKPER